MQTLITFTKEEYEGLRRNIVDRIIKDSKKRWGIEFISKETGRVMADSAVVGLFLGSVSSILPEV